jgi:Cu/Ag efflux pump CusA
MRIDEGLGGTPADLSVRIFGPDLDVLARLADEARDLMDWTEIGAPPPILRDPT